MSPDQAAQISDAGLMLLVIVIIAGFMPLIGVWLGKRSRRD